MKSIICLIFAFIISTPLFANDSFKKELLNGLLSKNKSDSEEAIGLIIACLETGVTTEEAISIVLFLAENVKEIKSDSISEIIYHFKNEEQPLTDVSFYDSLFNSYPKFTKDSQVALFHFVMQFEYEEIDDQFVRFLDAYGNDLLFLSPNLIHNSNHDLIDVSIKLLKCLSNENIKYSIYQIYSDYLISKSIESKDLLGLNPILIKDLTLNLNTYKIESKRKKKNILLLLKIANSLKVEINEKVISQTLSINDDDVTLAMVEVLFNQDKVVPKSILKKLASSELFKIYLFALCEKYQKNTDLIDKKMTQEDIARGKLMCWFYETMQMKVLAKYIEFNGFYKIEADKPERMALFKCAIEFPFIKEIVPIAASGGIFKDSNDLSLLERKSVGSDFILWIGQTSIKHVQSLKDGPSLGTGNIFDLPSGGKSEEGPNQYQEALLSASFGQTFLLQFKSKVEELYETTGILLEEDEKIFEIIFNDYGLIKAKYPLVKKGVQYIREGQFTDKNIELGLIATGQFENGILSGDFTLNDLEQSFKFIINFDHNEFKKIQLFDNNKLKASFSFSNQLLDGPLIFFNDSDKKISEDNYIKGKRQGISIEYYDNGKINRSLAFDKGLPVSDSLKYDEEGNLIVKIQFSKSWSGLCTVYFPNGKLKSKGFIKNQVLEGPVEEYFESGKLQMKLSYNQSQINGSSIIFFENGTVKSETNYVSGLRQGLEKHYHENGKLKFIINYVDDLMEGQCTSFNEDGILQNKLMFKNNLANGDGFQYNSKGELIAQNISENGKIREGTSFIQMTLELMEYKDFVLIKRFLCDESGKVVKEVKLYDEKTLSFVKKGINEGNLNLIKWINEKTPSILNSDLGDGQNSLHLACLNINVKTELVENLIELEVDVNHQDNFGNTPLHYALQNKFDTIVEMLLIKGAKLNLENKVGVSVLEALLNCPIIKQDFYLTDETYKIQLKNGQNLLHLATKCNQIGLIKSCIKFGIDINLKDAVGNTAISLAIFNDKKESIELLVSLGAVTSFYDFVCLGDLAKITKELNMKPSILNKPDGLGNTLLHYSVIKGKLEVFEYLVASKANLTIKNNIGLDPISLTIIYNQIQMFNYLVSKGLNIQEDFGEKRFALYYMVKHGMEELIKKYVENGFSLKIATPKEPNLLFVAVENNQEKLISYLIKKGVDVNEINKNNETCVQIALQNKNNNIFQLLLKNGSKFGLQEAIQYGDLKLIENSFQEYLDLGNSLYRKGILHWAVEAGQLDTVKFLLENNLDVNELDENNCAPLYLSLKLKNEKIAEFLINKGAKVFDEFLRGQPESWRLASENGFVKILILMLQKGFELNSPKANIMLEEFVTRGYYDVVEFFLKSDNFIFPEKQRNELIKILEKNKDEKMLNIINSKQPFFQYEPQIESELDGIYEAKRGFNKIKNGKFKKFNSKGDLSMSGSYINNLLEGLVYELLPEKYCRPFYSISNYKNGQLEGLKTTYYETQSKGDGVIKSKEFYVNGKLNGVSSYFDSMGSKLMEITFKDGSKNGPLKEWINENIIITDFVFKNDKIWNGFAILEENKTIEQKSFDFEDYNDALYNKRKAIKWEYLNGEIINKRDLLLSKNIFNIVDSGLDWLAKSQEDSGCWEPGKYEGQSNEQSKIFCSAFSLLTFLGLGHTDRAGKYKKNVKKACEWLLSVQHLDGSFTINNSINGICTMALAEAAGMGCGSKEMKNAAENACKFLLLQQNVSGGFDDFGKSEKAEQGEYDKMPPTAFCIMGLKSAILAGIQEKEIKECFEKVKVLFNKMPTTGDIGENSKGQAWSCAGESKIEGFSTGAFQGMALLVRQYLGHQRTEPWLKAAGTSLSLNLPADTKSINYVQGYFQFCSLFQQGGDEYASWEKVYSDLLFQAQTDEEKFFCSWPKIPSGQFSDGGRIISTAFALLGLEIHYRYKSVMK